MKNNICATLLFFSILFGSYYIFMFDVSVPTNFTEDQKHLTEQFGGQLPDRVVNLELSNEKSNMLMLFGVFFAVSSIGLMIPSKK